MLDIDRLLHSERAMQALTGVSLEQLQRLETPFAWELSALQHNKPRQRAPGGGCKHSLTSPRAKLVFMLLYLKCYPTFDLMGALFGVDRSRTCRWVHAWLPALRAALGHEAQLPERKARNMKEPRDAISRGDAGVAGRHGAAGATRAESGDATCGLFWKKEAPYP